MRIKQIGMALQRLYEAGVMSYPRTRARCLTTETIRRLGGAPHTAFSAPPVSGHEALHPRGHFELFRRQMPASELIRRVLDAVDRHTRQCLAYDRGDSPCPDALPPWARNLPWRREPSASRLPERFTDFVRQRVPDKAFRPDAPDVMALNLMYRHDLGRPATWIRHIEKLFARRLADERLRLTRKGRLWLETLPPGMASPALAAEIERRTRQPGSVSARVARAIEVLPPAVQTDIRRTIRTGDPRLKM